MEQPVVAGIDAGGTKTECWVADLNARVLAQAAGSGANLLAAGVPTVKTTVRQCVEAALQAAGRTWADVKAVCLAIAGYWPGRVHGLDEETFRDLFPRPIRLSLVPDVAAALQSAVGDAPGIALIAGTGSIAYGRNRQGATARAGGWGHLLGDEGSAYWIGLHGVRAALRSADGRERETLLTRTIPAALGCHEPADLVPIAYRTDRLGKAGMAALAPLVTEAAERGDPVATGILQEAAAELSLLVTAVATRLGMSGEAFPIVAAGGVFRAGEPILAPLRARLAACCPQAAFSLAEMRPAWGAVLFALRHLAAPDAG